MENDISDVFPELLTVHHKDGGCRSGHISYVNRNNRLSSALQKTLLENYGRYAFRYTEELRSRKVDVKGLFSCPDSPLVVEIGFGKGDSTFHDALQNLNLNFFCFDVFLQGFATLMSKASAAGLSNILLCHYDALDFLLHSMPESYVDKFNVFFPDPWPKKKHKKRRIICSDTIGAFVSCLKPGGLIHAATDIQDYAESIMSVFSSCSDLRNAYEGYAPEGVRSNMTAYERKALSEGRRAFDIIFEKI